MNKKYPLLVAFVSTLTVSSVNAAYIDVFQGGNLLGTIESYSGASTSVTNYDYYSAKNHLAIGPTITNQYGHIFFYEGSDGLSFNTIFSSGGSFSSTSKVKWDITVSGSTTNPTVLVADDVRELYETSTNNLFKGNWRYNDGYGDGGVIGEIGGNSWEITIDPVSYSGGSYELYNLASYSDNGTNIALNINTTESIVFKPSVKVPEPSILALFAIGFLVFSSSVKRNSQQRRWNI